MTDAEIKEIFLANGFTIKTGCDDLKPYVYEAARALLDRAESNALNAVDESPHNALLREWQFRHRVMPRDVASHPKTLGRVMAEMDTDGPSEAGDCIQSLVFELQIARERAKRFADELMSRT